jgi:5-methylcytosine-specific restriction endonuclease McrA
VSQAWRDLGGRRRTIARQVYARDKATPGYVCHCGRPIDWMLAWPEPMSRSVDHAHETQDGGPLTDMDNLVTAHLGCNASKGAARRHERAREARPSITSTIIIDPATL